MKSIKQLLILLLIFITATALVACGNKNKGEQEHYCTYSDWVTVKEADCVNDGLKEMYCYGCSEKKSEIIDAYGHLFSASVGSFAEEGDGFVYQKACINGSCNAKENVTTGVIIEVTDPTCEKSGTEKKIYRAVVDGMNYDHVVTTVIPTVEHDYSYTAGTWTWNGYEEATYTVSCKMNYNHKHSYPAQITSVTTPATCTVDGSIEYTATVVINGESYSRTVSRAIPRIKHNFDYDNGEWVWDGTDIATYVVKCVNDPTHTDTKTVYPTSSSTSVPTCEKGAETTYTVKVYVNGKYYTDTKVETKEPLGHDYDVASAEWQWSDDGTAAQLVFTCKNGTPHSAIYDAVVEYESTVLPGCFNGGLAHAIATLVLDGETYTDEVDVGIAPLDHELDWENGYWEWDETKGATLVIPCTLGEPHNLEEYVSADMYVLYPDCTNDGYELYTVEIEVYGYLISDDIRVTIPATGHNFEIDKVTWLGDDPVSAKIDLVCQNNTGHTHSDLAFATSEIWHAPTCTLPGDLIYTATIEVDGKTFSATTTGVAEKTGHTFGGTDCYVCGVPVYSYGLELELNSDKTGYVVKSAGSYAGERLSIPAEYNGLPVVEIAEYAFSGNKNIREVYFSENILVIEYKSFNECTSLEYIYFSENEHKSVDIKGYAFAYCAAMKELYLPNDVKYVREGAFYGCSSVESVRVVAKNLYDGSLPTGFNLRNIELLPGVEYVGNLFDEYTPIFSLTIPSTVKYVSESLLSNERLIEIKNLSNLNITTNYTVKNVYSDTEGQSYLWTDPYTGYVFFEKGGMRYLMGHSGEGDVTTLPENCNGYSYQIYSYALVDIDFGYQPLYIPDAVTTICRYAAHSNKTLTVVWGGEKVTDIGVYAFAYCDELLSITLGSSLTKIYEYAFYGCNRVCELINHSKIDVQGGSVKMFQKAIAEITSMSVTEPAIYFIDGFAFYYRGETCYLVSYFGDGDDTVEGQLTLPDLPDDWNVYTYGIYYRAIRAVEGVKKIKLSSSVDQICTEAFFSDFEEIHIPVISALKRIEENAFKWTIITDIFLPSELEYIGKNAFPKTLEKADFACVDDWKILVIGWNPIKTENLIDDETAAKYLIYHNLNELKREPEENE